MKETCIAGIVTYNPEEERLRRNLERIVPQVESAVVIDNGSGNLAGIREILEGFPGVKLICNGRNTGIAHAMNQIGDEAERLGSPFFMTLDQDSVADEGMAGKLLELFADPTVGGATPYINDKGDFVPEDRAEECFTAISSGFVVRTSLWKEIGGFWEYLFIDEVDHEFCYRIREKGFRILCRRDTSLDHILGASFTKTVLGHRMNPKGYSPFRRYYIARNSVIMNRLFPEDTGIFRARKEVLLRTMISIVLCEKQRTRKIAAMLRGIRDGRRWCRQYTGTIERRNYRETEGEA